MLLLDRETVRRVFSMSRAIEVMAEAMRRYSGGRVEQPLRTMISPDDDGGFLATMPGYLAGDTLAGYGLKALMCRPDNAADGRDVLMGVVMVFHPGTGEPLALMDAGAVTAIRTAAVSAVATDVLARPDAGDLAVLGSGVQARSHLEAMAAVRTLTRVRVWSRTRENADAYARWAANDLGLGVEVKGSVAEAVRGADLVCTTTAAEQPIVTADMLGEGVHINAVGFSSAEHRELCSRTVAGAALFVDSRESAAAEAGDLLVPVAEGVIGLDHIAAELGEVLLGRHPGRRQVTERTIYKSLGLAVQDVMSGLAIVEAARQQGAGQSFTLS